MSFQNPLPLSKTSLDVQITYNNSALDQPVQLNIGNAIDGIIECDVADNINVDPTATGDISYAEIAVFVNGKIHLHPGSPAIPALSAANKAAIPGTIAVKFPTAGISYTYPNVFITSPFKGHTAGKEIADYSYTFKCSIPDETSLGGLSALGLVNQV